MVISIAIVAIYRIWLDHTTDIDLMVMVTFAVAFVAGLVIYVARLPERVRSRSLGCFVRVLPLDTLLLSSLFLVMRLVLRLISRDWFAWQLVVGEIVEHIAINRPILFASSSNLRRTVLILLLSCLLLLKNLVVR